MFPVMPREQIPLVKKPINTIGYISCMTTTIEHLYKDIAYLKRDADLIKNCPKGNYELSEEAEKALLKRERHQNRIILI